MTITFTGDVILDRGVADKMAIYGDSMLSRSIQPFLQSDFNLINLETVLTNRPYDTSLQTFQFKQNKEISFGLKSGGVTHASVANNHGLDFQSDGFDETIQSLDDVEIGPIGQECNTVLLTKGKEIVGVMAISLSSNNRHLCLNNEPKILNQIQAFKSTNQEIPLIVYIHWGLEYQRTAESWQQNLARQFIDRGADAVIGHHSHVFQNVEFYRDRPIVYSLGNFVADAYLPNTTKGMIATLSFEKSKPVLLLKPIDLQTYFPHKMDLKSEILFLADNLKFQNGMCFFKVVDRWQIKEIDKITFAEDTNDWLFHVKNQDQIWIRKLKNGIMRLSIINNGSIKKSVALHGLLSEIEISDITNDGSPEILLGITKEVNFDKSWKKRLNIFRIEDGGLKAVWLGTHFLHDLNSYRTISLNSTNFLQTVEIDSLNHIYDATYEWDEFGFALKEITLRNE